MLSRTRLPPSGFIEPCLPSPAEHPPSGPSWIHEIKHDGFQTQTHFAFRIDAWTADGESIVEHLAGVEDYTLPMAAYRAAIERWPNTPITLRQGARVIEDSRRLRLAWSVKGRQGGR
jgi:hypothetical protein